MAAERRLGDDVRGRAVTGERWRSVLVERGWLLDAGDDDSEPARRVRRVVGALEALEAAERDDARLSAPQGMGAQSAGAREGVLLTVWLILSTAAVTLTFGASAGARSFPFLVLAIPTVWGGRMWRSVRAHARDAAAARARVLERRAALERSLEAALARPFVVPSGDGVAWCDAEDDALRARIHAARTRGTPDAEAERDRRARQIARARTCADVARTRTGTFVDVTAEDRAAAEAVPEPTPEHGEGGLEGVEALAYEG